MRYWHGGVPGLKPGDVLVPPEVSGVSDALSEYREMFGVDPALLRRDRVYVATDRQVARAYAAFRPSGSLYEVRPEGVLEPDPDCSVDGLSWQCERAVVVSVVDPLVWFRGRPLRHWMRLLNGV